MRIDFINGLCEQAADDERIFLLTADLGWSVLERFASAFPRRFLNVGVAEQNMLGIAAGLAREGYTPFVYSIATFASMRCYEQFRDGIDERCRPSRRCHRRDSRAWFPSSRRQIEYDLEERLEDVLRGAVPVVESLRGIKDHGYTRRGIVWHKPGAPATGATRRWRSRLVSILPCGV